MRTFILIFHESLYIPDMDVNLVNPQQLRHQDIEVNAIPLFQLQPEERTMESHSIISKPEGLHIPLMLQGTMSGFTVRKPTSDEIRDSNQDKVTYVHMTSDMEWKPHDDSFAAMEQALRDDLNRGYGLHRKEPRTISSYQARGQDETAGTVNPVCQPRAGRNSLATVHTASVDFTSGYEVFDSYGD